MVVLPRTRPALTPDHPVQWRTAAPLWRFAEPTDNATLLRPALLRFTSDNFMDDFLTVATQAPERLGEWQVQPETWRQPAPIPPLPPLPSAFPAAATETAESDSEPLRLYQPAHERYYLVTANLVCRVPGLPDRTLKTNNDEQVSFVLRRYLEDAADNQVKEHALVGDRWQPVGDIDKQLLPGEATFPMFPVTYSEAGDYRRRSFAGLVPVGERERLLNAPRQSVPEADATATAANSLEDRLDQLVTLFNLDVAAPWRELRRPVGEDPTNSAAPPGRELGPFTRTVQTSFNDINADGDDGDRQALQQTVIAQRDQLQLSSWYVLLDFASFLQTYLPQLWRVINGEVTVSSLPSAQRNLYNALDDIRFRPADETEFELGGLNDYYELLVGQQAAPGVTSIRLTRALRDAEEKRGYLEQTTVAYDSTNIPSAQDWPESVFLLCGRGLRAELDALDDTHDPDTRELTAPGLIRLALAAEAATATRPIPQTPLAQAISFSAKTSDVANNGFVIRCVFERPHCPPSLHPAVVSEPTQRFQMASYFDPDAPARPIRIPMPVDTSPAGLRKFAKNTSFVISDSLSCQIEKARSLTFGDLVLSVLPWPFNKKLNTSGAKCDSSGIDIGKICTLSIPIITICALILLIIFVLLLDIIFKWVPYLIFCLPIPGLKAKEN
ncbi:MAG: hypothetical protein AAF215_22760 [Cyanobacteria bacterium P01_A01_bin.123]